MGLSNMVEIIIDFIDGYYTANFGLTIHVEY